MPQPYFVRNIVAVAVVRMIVERVRSSRKRVGVVVGSYHLESAPIAVVLEPVGRRGLFVGLDIVRKLA